MSTAPAYRSPCLRALPIAISVSLLGSAQLGCSPPGCHNHDYPPYVVFPDGGIPAGLFDGGTPFNTTFWCTTTCGDAGVTPVASCTPQPDAGANAVSCTSGSKTSSTTYVVYADAGIPVCAFNPPPECSTTTWCPNVCNFGAGPGGTCGPSPDAGATAIECSPYSMRCL